MAGILTKLWSFPQIIFQWLSNHVAELLNDNLWQKMLKNVLSTAITITIGVIPAVVSVYGKSTFLGAMAASFGQPGQRFGQMAETLSLIALGTVLGLAWGNLGLLLSSLVYADNHSAASAIRGIFFVLATIFHGLIRSAAPRLFQLVFFFMLINLSILTGAAKEVALAAVKAVIYPIFTAIGVMVLVNVLVFPQFSSGFLGKTTVDTLKEVITSFQTAGSWFVTDSTSGKGKEGGETSSQSQRTKLVSLTDEKAKLRTCLASCKAAQAECNFELVLAVLPPRSLKPISVTMMTRLVQVTIALISACESKFALAAYEEIISTSEGSNGKEADGGKSDSDSRCDEKTEKHKRNIDLIKPTREIESSDIDLFEDILSPIRLPAREMQDHIQDAVNTIMSALIYCYDVPKPKSEPASKPDSILKEMDKGTDKLTKALAKFDAESAATLESAAASTYGEDLMRNVTPRMETHLISTFLINISQAGSQVLDMLKHARTLIERKHSRNSRRRLYWPRISWKKWLTSGGESDGNALPENARKEARAGFGMTEDSKNTDDEATSTSTETLLNPKHDIETGEVCGGRPAEFQRGRIPRRKGPKKAKASTGLWTRGIAADVVEFLMDSSDLTFALKMTVAALLVTWPAFIPSLNPWYVSVRGTWATLQLILVFEVSIGTSFRGFFLRAFGTIFGCSIGIVAFEVGQGNLVVLVVVLVIGLIPSSFIHLTTSYVKAGVISMISLAVVGISTVVPVNQDSPEETYVKRLICFLVGGVVALLVEMIFFPVRARDRLVECLASSIKQISIMEASVAVGVDSTDKVDLKSHALNASFKSAKDKAEQALIAAKTFLPFCLTEPRIKGSFRGQALVYGEMIYVLFQIIERIDNMLHIRKLYGSTILEELHAEILPYRRNVAGCVSLTLFAVGEALTTRLPLPQFLPSSRVAQLRNVARVREILLERSRESAQADVAIESGSNGSPRVTSHEINDPTVQSLTQRNFLAWNASSINMMEIIEYLEELVDLAKLLVGVNAFRSGMLERPKFQQYIHKIRARETEAAAAKSNILESKKPRGRKGNRQPPGDQPADATSTGLRRRQTTHVGPQATGGAPHYGDDFFDSSDLPLSLQRVISKRMDRGDRLSRLKRTDIGSGNPHTLRSAKTWMG